MATAEPASDIIIVRTPNNNGNNNWWGSAHTAGPQFVNCDGSVRTIPYSQSGQQNFRNYLNYQNNQPITFN